MKFLGEVKDRGVVSFGTVYLGASWLVVVVGRGLFDVFDLDERKFLMENGGQGQNRTAATRIFSPRQSAPRSAQEHLSQPVARKRGLIRC